MDKPIETQDKYMPQLDCLRAIAVASVAYNHWLPDWTFNLPFGNSGVQLFFVLSGFLITGILVRARSACSNGGRFHVLRSFYARRFLRIFPLYYGVVLVACLADVEPFRETVLWNVTYTTNFYLFFRQDFHLWISHFWSLAVEEQFYLVWPFVMLFAPVRRLKSIIVATITLAIVYRVGIALAFPGVRLSGVLLIGNLHALGGGALLAVLCANSKAAIRLTRWCLIIGGCGTIILYGYGYAAPGPSSQVVLEFRHVCMISLFCWVTHAAAVGFRGRTKALFENPVLVSLGTVSYGIYILHNLATPALTHFADALGIDETVAGGIPRLLCLVAMTVGCAYLSWFLYEKPINSYKRYFPYRPALSRVACDDYKSAAAEAAVVPTTSGASIAPEFRRLQSIWRSRTQSTWCHSQVVAKFGLETLSMDRDLDISVMFSTYNRSEYLRQTLEAMCALDLDGLDVEFVVVDNNSTDDTAEVIDSFAGRLPLLHLFEARPGQNAARNHALDSADIGKIVVFTDDDVVPRKDWLKQILGACEQWPEYDVGGGKIELIWPDGVEAPRWAKENEGIRGIGFAEHDLGPEPKVYQGGSTPCGPNYWVRGKVFSGGIRLDDSLGPMPGQKFCTGNETEFLLRLAAEGRRALYVPGAVVGHRVQPSLLETRNMLKRAIRHGRGWPRASGIPEPEKLTKHPWRWRMRRIVAMAWYIARFLRAQLHWDECLRMKNAVEALCYYAYHREALSMSKGA